jgi:hypothetical protein
VLLIIGFFDSVRGGIRGGISKVLFGVVASWGYW